MWITRLDAQYDASLSSIDLHVERTRLALLFQILTVAQSDSENNDRNGRCVYDVNVVSRRTSHPILSSGCNRVIGWGNVDESALRGTPSEEYCEKSFGYAHRSIERRDGNCTPVSDEPELPLIRLFFGFSLAGHLG